MFLFLLLLLWFLSPCESKVHSRIWSGLGQKSQISQKLSHHAPNRIGPSEVPAQEETASCLLSFSLTFLPTSLKFSGCHLKEFGDHRDPSLLLLWPYTFCRICGPEIESWKQKPVFIFHDICQNGSFYSTPFCRVWSH